MSDPLLLDDRGQSTTKAAQTQLELYYEGVPRPATVAAAACEDTRDQARPPGGPTLPTCWRGAVQRLARTVLSLNRPGVSGDFLA
jgi:hypothetical protein